MLFIKCDELKPGMRLAKPIYSKKGVLLYDRASALKDQQSIENIKGFGLMGLFVLEPAEPVPPMTEEDLEFERFQTVMYNEIMEELNHIRNKHKADRFAFICSQIIKNYGNLLHLLSLNVAILSALITHTMNVPLSDQNEAVEAAIIHDIGKLTMPSSLQSKMMTSKEDRAEIDRHEMAGYEIIDDTFPSSPNIRRSCNQARKVLLDYWDGKEIESHKMFTAAKVLVVAGFFDKETAVRVDTSPVSEVAVIRKMMEREDVFDPKVVKGLIDSLNILMPGVSVELNTGEKALVIKTNDREILRPTILSFRDNSIIDLSNRRAYSDLEIVDIMKTMDNRYVMDTEKMKALGINLEEQI